MTGWLAAVRSAGRADRGCLIRLMTGLAAADIGSAASGLHSQRTCINTEKRRITHSNAVDSAVRDTIAVIYLVKIDIR